MDIDPGTPLEALTFDVFGTAVDWRGSIIREGEALARRHALDELLDRFEIELDEPGIADLNLAWHRLDPWPDAVEGLTRLRPNYKLATLSNGNVSLLVDMAKRAGLPWDCILSAAAHPDDLRAAAALGLRTALVTRPEEFGPERGLYYDLDEQTDFDLVAEDFLDLADQLATDL